MPQTPLVCIVDDDESVRTSLQGLFASAGVDAVTFGSAEDLLRANVLDTIGCLVLDVRMPGMTGPELQRELLARGVGIPVVFISATSDTDVRDRALREGAIAYLFKPFSDEGLLEIVCRTLGIAV